MPSGEGGSVISIDDEAIPDKSIPHAGWRLRLWQCVLSIVVILLLAGCVAPMPPARTAVPSPTRPPVALPAGTARPSPTRSPVASTVRATTYPALPAGLSRAQVVRVVDGDTVDVIVEGGEERVRLIGLDTPETHSPREPVQCFGSEATERAVQLLDEQTVFVELDSTQGVRDRYGRLLGYLWLTDGRLVNLELIAEGYAFEYTYDRPYKYQAVFRQAEKDAQARQAGLWSPQTCNGEGIPAAPVSGSQVPNTARSAAVGASTLQVESVRAAGGDEIVTIVNHGTSGQTMTGWWVQSAGGKTCQPVPGQVFYFPAGYLLADGARVRIHSGPQALNQPPDDLFWQADTVWNNDGDRAELHSPEGVVATMVYGGCQ